ncbi:hypothetical protein [Dictyobacter kobayashii]|uniref:Uncharacterized protein n=1 Tax=Dictyobacter kobayashii TaxID=2014872 RepID=A0A402AFS2_9CHLR|nr:hypothetical protein [Dictyobacter kobayashii]GCE17949.1 hypothetical protein KDK_17490 [Dictyobacter kobayashii]
MQRQLTDVRSINTAVWDNVSGRNNGVFCRLPDGSTHRINRARTVHGQLQVHSLHADRWVVPALVYQA